jgi:hypothetical protein
VLIALIFVALVIAAAELNHRIGHFVQQSTLRKWGRTGEARFITTSGGSCLASLR